MEKRSISKTVITCLVVLVLFLLLQTINLSAPSNLSPGSKYLKLRTSLKRDPVLLPSSATPQRCISCDRSHKNYDLCTINGPSVLDPTNFTFHVANSTPPPYTTEKIRPYPRKWENFMMSRIKQLTLTSSPSSSPCKYHHNAPALVFSAGGYTGNFFHEFNDGFIPLFITVNSIFPNHQDFILVISQARDWWVNKYADLLRTFSRHPIMNLDHETSTHCFPSATFGLISHGFMTVNPTLMPNPKNFGHFRAFLDKAYGISHGQNRHHSKLGFPRPRLVLASRSGGVGRVILNQNDVKLVAQKVGFDVIIFEPTSRTPLHEAYAIINSSHAMVGVHGAALTHSLFLRPGSVLMQVVPLGAEWVAEVCFENSARAMGLEYVEYKIVEEESSLVEKYNKSSLLIKDPVAFIGKKWSSAIMDIYLKEQNVRINLVRFRKYLKKAYEKAKKFMDKEKVIEQNFHLEATSNSEISQWSSQG